MKSIEVDVRNTNGLHVRSAAEFVRVAALFVSRTSVQNLTVERPRGDAKSLLAVLSCGVACGHRVRLTAVGSDEDAALASLSDLLQHDLP